MGCTDSFKTIAVAICISLVIFTVPNLINAEKIEIPVNNDNYNVTYEVFVNSTHPKASRIEFEIHANTTGWVGFGFNAEAESMTGADVFIGGINSTFRQPNLAFGDDYHVPKEGPKQPVKDTAGNYFIFNANEGNGTTYLHIGRFLDTNDKENDTLIEEDKPINFIWAYNAETDEPTMPHSQKGVVPKITFLSSSASLTSGCFAIFVACLLTIVKM